MDPQDLKKKQVVSTNELESSAKAHVLVASPSGREEGSAPWRYEPRSSAALQCTLKTWLEQVVMRRESSIECNMDIDICEVQGLGIA